MSIKNKIAVIVLNYNTSDDCRKCISYIKQQTGVEVEVVVIDNASRQEDAEKLTKICEVEHVSLLKSKENRGYSAGNNIGLRYAAQQGYIYAMILNPDMELHQHDYLQRMAVTMDADNAIAVLGTDIVNVEGNHQNPLREVSFIEELFWFYELLPLRKKRRLTCAKNYARSRCCEKLSGCCFMIRLSFAMQIGFLDEKTFLYCEEPILAKQVQQSGIKMYYMSDLQAFHNHKKSEKGDPTKRLQIFAESRNYYLKTYSGFPRIAVWLLRLSRLSQQFVYSLLKRRQV